MALLAKKEKGFKVWGPGEIWTGGNMKGKYQGDEGDMVLGRSGISVVASVIAGLSKLETVYDFQDVTEETEETVHTLESVYQFIKGSTVKLSFRPGLTLKSETVKVFLFHKATGERVSCGLSVGMSDGTKVLVNCDSKESFKGCTLLEMVGFDADDVITESLDMRVSTVIEERGIEGVKGMISAITFQGPLVKVTAEGAQFIAHDVGETPVLEEHSLLVEFANRPSKVVALNHPSVSVMCLDDVDFNSTADGEFVVSYVPMEGEALSGEGKFISKVVATTAKGSGDTFKFFIVPFWNRRLARYKLTVYLASSDANIFIDVSDVVVMSSSDGGEFECELDGRPRRLSLSLDVSGLFPMQAAGMSNKVFSQVSTISLQRPLASDMPVTIDYNNDEIDVLGKGRLIRSENGSRLRCRLFWECATVSEVLIKYYNTAGPVSTGGLKPNYFILSLGDETIKEGKHSDILEVFSSSKIPVKGTVLTLRWFHRDDECIRGLVAIPIIMGK